MDISHCNAGTPEVILLLQKPCSGISKQWFQNGPVYNVDDLTVTNPT